MEISVATLRTFALACSSTLGLGLGFGLGFGLGLGLGLGVVLGLGVGWPACCDEREGRGTPHAVREVLRVVALARRGVEQVQRRRAEGRRVGRRR